MDVSGIGSLTTALSSSQGANGASTEASTQVLKKALEIQQQTAQQLIEALPQVQGTNNPAHLGQTIDIKA